MTSVATWRISHRQRQRVSPAGVRAVMRLSAVGLVDERTRADAI